MTSPQCISRISVLISAATVAASLTFAQPPPPDTLVSPEISADRKVTFRVRAPKAAQVTLFGAWMPLGTQEPMTRNAEGIWSVTVGPLAPNGYLYSFTIDGVTVADPVNPDIKLRQRTSASLLEVPNTSAPEPWEVSDVAHGSVEISWLKSNVLEQSTRQVFVYLPPGYEKSNSRYPVLYLFHGSGDVAASWMQAGKANLILDNLIAAKKAVPMIVVMPLGHAVPFGSTPAIQAKNVSLYDEYLFKEIIPWVDGKYRVARGRENHAIAGLSMGGGQSSNIGFAHLDYFSAIGVFSSSGGNEFANRFKEQLADSKATNAKLKLLWIATGKQDAGYSRTKQFTDLLAKNQIKHVFKDVEGGHVWAVWRWALAEFTPLLFHR